MLRSIQFIEGVGQFEQAAGGQQLPFRRMTLVYAENGRGKTTLSAILRSLGTGLPLDVAERRRLPHGAQPRVVVNCDRGAGPAVFENNQWNRTVPELAVFDDIFVDRNVYSGLTVESAHRQGLHEFILGAEGVTMNQALKDAIAEVTTRTREIAAASLAIPTERRLTLSVEQFCALQPVADLDQAIMDTERSILAANQAALIRDTPPFDQVSLPLNDVAALRAVLELDFPALDREAAARVQEHLQRLGAGAENWIAQGMDRMAEAPEGETPPCPFCAQPLGGSSVMVHYREYFSEGYGMLKLRVLAATTDAARDHGGTAPANFERAARILGERAAFWGRFGDLPDVTIDTAAVNEVWTTAFEAVRTALAVKIAAPLDRVELTPAAVAAIEAYNTVRAGFEAFNQRIADANTRIQATKGSAGTADRAALAGRLAHLHATRNRYVPEIAARCATYSAAVTAKAQAEQARVAARQALDHYRAGVFPAIEPAINEYLQRFGAGFRLRGVTSANVVSGSVCNYEVLINNTPVPVAGGQPAAGVPSFRNTLSAGDRNTLALSFFFASLDRDPGLANKIVVIDDPISSLDDHRSITTVQEIQRLLPRVGQVVVLSHSKPFLCAVWLDTNPALRTALSVERVGQTTSDLRQWNVDQDCVTAHDRRHALLRTYLDTGAGDRREVAVALRLVLEVFLRAAFPRRFLPGAFIGNFLNDCRQLLGTTDEMLDAADIVELDALLAYAHLFHHDTNTAGWQTIAINDGQLSTFVRRTLQFARK